MERTWRIIQIEYFCFPYQHNESLDVGASMGFMRRERRYSYIWCNTKPPPRRAIRWAVLLAGVAFLLLLWVEGATVELDPTLRDALSVIENMLR